jgi:hypothetical protein
MLKQVIPIALVAIGSCVTPSAQAGDGCGYPGYGYGRPVYVRPYAAYRPWGCYGGCNPYYPPGYYWSGDQGPRGPIVPSVNTTPINPGAQVPVGPKANTALIAPRQIPPLGPNQQAVKNPSPPPTPSQSGVVQVEPDSGSKEQVDLPEPEQSQATRKQSDTAKNEVGGVAGKDKRG